MLQSTRLDAGKEHRLEVTRSTSLRDGSTCLVRLTTPSDFAAISALLDEIATNETTLADTGEPTTSSLLGFTIAAIGQGGGVSLTAVRNTQVVGNLLIERDPSPVKHHVGQIGIIVAPSCRSLGIGTLLITQGEAWARAAGMSLLTLEVFQSNTRACALYERLGFHIDGVRTNYIIDEKGSHDVVLMSKELHLS